MRDGPGILLAASRFAALRFATGSSHRLRYGQLPQASPPTLAKAAVGASPQLVITLEMSEGTLIAGSTAQEPMLNQTREVFPHEQA